MRQKLIGAGAAIVLVSLAAVGAFASQDGVDFQELDATETSEATATTTATEEPTATATEEATETAEATKVAEPTEESEECGDDEVSGLEEGGDGCHGGIPDDNPVFGPDDGDGVCEKHETGTKTTPSGNIINVPCHASDDAIDARREAKDERRGAGGDDDDSHEDDDEGEQGEDE